MPTISILTTCYNRDKYLAECIESVLNSNYNDYEMIIVDDASTDKSLQIAQEYARKDKRIKVYQNEKNLGDYPNRNMAAQHATGKYLKYLDADDTIGKYLLDIMIEAMEANPEAKLGIYNSRTNDDHHQLLSPEQLYHVHYVDGIKHLNSPPLYAIINAATFHSLGGFKPQAMTGDYEMWHRLGRQYFTLIIASAQVMYRIHDNQQINTMVDPLVQQAYLLTAESLLTHPDCPLDEKIKLHELNKSRRNIARQIVYAGLKLNSHTMNKLKMASRKHWHEIALMAVGIKTRSLT